MDFRRRSYLAELQKKVSHDTIDLALSDAPVPVVNPMLSSPSVSNPFSSTRMPGTSFDLQPNPHSSTRHHNKSYILIETLTPFLTFALFLLPAAFLLLSSALNPSLGMFKEIEHFPAKTHTVTTASDAEFKVSVGGVPTLSGFLHVDAKYRNISAGSLEQVKGERGARSERDEMKGLVGREGRSDEATVPHE